MGINTVSKSRIVNKDNLIYKSKNLVFPSRFVFSTIESIDRNLRIIYSKAPPNSGRDRINYSTVRDDEEEFDTILDRVEERINRINKINGKVKIIETDDAAFNRTFLGIMDFLYEASVLPSNSENHFEKRFIDLANRLWEMGICLSEF